jgi:hypothetical protein
MANRRFSRVLIRHRSISTIQGRPLGLADDTFDVSLPNNKSPGDLADGSLSASNTADAVTMPYSIQIFKMARYISKIKFGFYRLSSPIDNSLRQASLTDMQSQLRQELDDLLAQSLAVVSATAPPDQRFRLLTKLKIQYHSAMCLLHQPSQAIVRPHEEALQTCFDSAAQRLRLYETLYDSGTLLHSWRTMQDMFLAGATVMYCVSISPKVRRSISLSALARDFRSCSSMLSVGGEWWPMIRKARSSLERLASHTLETFAEKSRSGSDTPHATLHFPVDSNSVINSFEGNLESVAVENELASFLNSDGPLSNIFDAPMLGFMDEILIYTQNQYAYEPFMGSNFDGDEFTNATSQHRSDDRDLRDFIDNLGDT